MVNLTSWQTPCITEGAASTLHSSEPSFDSKTGVVNVYVSIPWATWIDLDLKGLMTPHHTLQRDFYLRKEQARLAHILHQANLRDAHDVKIYTVCQHVTWQRALPFFLQLGITDLMLSHCTDALTLSDFKGMTIHPWSLYAVNVEDSGRRHGIQIAKPIKQKKYLASFIGTYADHYISDVRARLFKQPFSKDIYVKKTQRWHFEANVYDQQLRGLEQTQSEQERQDLLHYNQVLSDSVFSLCPAGAGPNTLRLWESLAVGAIPVILGPAPTLPKVRHDQCAQWSDIVLFHDEHELNSLNQVLAAISESERIRRQALCLRIYEQLKNQACFDLFGD